MMVKIWGSRGMMPVSGSRYKNYGSDTACVEARTKSGTSILLDAGTGLGAYGRYNKGMESPGILLSSPHLDHIQGLSLYSAPASKHLSIYGPRPGEDASLESALVRVFDGILLPDIFAGGKIDLLEIRPGEKFLIGDAMVEAISANPSGASLVWKISADGQTLVYCADEISMAEASPALLDFMAGADLALINGGFQIQLLKRKRPTMGAGRGNWGKGASGILSSPISSLIIPMK